MEGFQYFSQLPPELRLGIWKHALQEEAESRLVLFHQKHHRVLPFKYLVSPILAVNAEARNAARKFYDVQLPVRPMFSCPFPSESIQRAYLNHWKGFPYYSNMEYWDDSGRMVERAIDNSFGKKMGTRRSTRSRDRPPEGTIYLSTQRLDIFKAHLMQAYSPDFMSISIDISGLCAIENEPVFRPTRIYLSDPIAPEVLGNVSKVILARWALGRERDTGIFRLSGGQWCIPYAIFGNGLEEFLQAALQDLKGKERFIQELVLHGRGDYTILKWETE
ncbi:hypothetical protein PG994_006991 [Apiospora phragmitis]|uniref:2EXR domain-containing protein n=1 Tax=Apiospora phragmitis TaxID=2905665 RepID=A0ABR1V2W2_9PEZI